MMKEIPFVDLKAGFAPFKDEIMHAIETVLRDMHLNNGPNVHGLESEFASYCGTKYSIGVGSGTEAIQFALLSAEIQKGDEVITAPNTFFATVEAILSVGASPVFVDIDPLTYMLNPDQLESKITKRTKAIIPVHMYGQTAEMNSILDIAEKHELAVIEDSCQAHGALYGDKKAGSMGIAGCFSFYYTKNLGCYGEGGIMTTDDEYIDQQVRLYRNHGHASKYEHVVVGYNGRLDEIQAAILRIKLKYLDEFNRQRRTKASRYNTLLKNTPLVLPIEGNARHHVYHLYVVQSKERDRLMAYLNSQGINCGIHYRIPIHMQAALSGLGYQRGDFPEAEKICDQIISLPLYPELEEEDQVYITNQIKKFYSL